MSVLKRPPDTEDSRDSRSMLIVEDHAATGRALRALLESAFPSHTVFVAESGEIALELCKAEAPELVIMDISLPGMNGVEATRRIKALAPATHVVMNSSNDMQIFREESAKVGASAFVSKGHTSIELVPVISRLLTLADPARRALP